MNCFHTRALAAPRNMTQTCAERAPSVASLPCWPCPVRSGTYAWSCSCIWPTAAPVGKSRPVDLALPEDRPARVTRSLLSPATANPSEAPVSPRPRSRRIGHWPEGACSPARAVRGALTWRISRLGGPRAGRRRALAIHSAINPQLSDGAPVRPPVQVRATASACLSRSITGAKASSSRTV